MQVDVSTYPAAYRIMFRTFTGTWSVAPADGGTMVTLRFEAQLRPIPGLPAPAHRYVERAGADVAAILDSYQYAAERHVG